MRPRQTVAGVARRMDLSPDPLYQLERYRPRFYNPINAHRRGRFESLTLKQGGL
jgi:hypothetical protein